MTSACIYGIGAIGGYLAAKSDAEHYHTEWLREHQEVREKSQLEEEEVKGIFRSYGLSEAEIQPIVGAMKKQPDSWVDFMMRFELGLEKPDPKRAMTSALTIAGAYIGGGCIPLAPYIFSASASARLPVSVAVTLVALSIFGFIKGRFTGASPFRSAFQTALVGGLAAAAAFTIARLIA